MLVHYHISFFFFSKLHTKDVPEKALFPSFLLLATLALATLALAWGWGVGGTAFDVAW